MADEVIPLIPSNGSHNRWTLKKRFDPAMERTAIRCRNWAADQSVSLRRQLPANADLRGIVADLDGAWPELLAVVVP
jgi:hypothetical protein